MEVKNKALNLIELWYFPIYSFKKLFYSFLVVLSSIHLHHGFVQFDERKQTEILNICILAAHRKTEICLYHTSTINTRILVCQQKFFCPFYSPLLQHTKLRIYISRHHTSNTTLVQLWGSAPTPLSSSSTSSCCSFAHASVELTNRKVFKKSRSLG